jgi:pimeloyl-ACP methyl ester carboxylesterase
MKLRLYHHRDGARIAYREAGTGPPLALVHSAGLSHREFEPLVEDLAGRYRVVLPDLPLHGDSEDRPRHPYTPDWTADVLAGFLHETCGPRPLVGGHETGALILLHAIRRGSLEPSRLVLMPSPLHRRAPRHRAARAAARAAALPGLDHVVSHGVRLVARPKRADALSAGSEDAKIAARDLVRHAVADLPGNTTRARAWSKAAAHWPVAWPDLIDLYGEIVCPTLLLWADHDTAHPLQIAEEALDLLPDGQLRTLSGTGFLIAYDDPVGVVRELSAFCG